MATLSTDWSKPSPPPMFSHPSLPFPSPHVSLHRSGRGGGETIAPPSSVRHRLRWLLFLFLRPLPHGLSRPPPSQSLSPAILTSLAFHSSASCFAAVPVAEWTVSIVREGASAETDLLKVKIILKRHTLTLYRLTVSFIITTLYIFALFA